MKTERNPKGAGRKPSPNPRSQQTLMLDQDHADWLDNQLKKGVGRSDLVNLAITEFRRKFNLLSAKSPEES